MSFPTKNDAQTFRPIGQGCAACFAVDETPVTLYACLTGVLTGNAHGGGDPPPPNGTFKMDWTANCFWFGQHDGFDFSFFYIPSFTTIEVKITGDANAFLQIDFIGCSKWWSNGLDVPAGNHYYGGFASINNIMPEVDYSVQDVLSLIAMEPDELNYCRPLPLTAEQTVYRFSRSSDRSNIRVLIDES